MTFVSFERADSVTEVLRHDSWIESLRARDEDAWRALHEREFALLYRFAIGLGARPELADDAANESFMRLLKSIRRIRVETPTALRAWLLVVCRNYLRDEFRRRRPIDLGDTDPGLAGDDEPNTDTRVALASALAALPESQREVIALRFVVGLPTREVAAVSGRGEKAVESLQHRALETLRRSLALEGYAP